MRAWCVWFAWLFSCRLWRNGVFCWREGCGLRMVVNWPSGLRRQFKALVRKGVGSNPTLANFLLFAPLQPPSHAPAAFPPPCHAYAPRQSALQPLPLTPRGFKSTMDSTSGPRKASTFVN